MSITIQDHSTAYTGLWYYCAVHDDEIFIHFYTAEELEELTR